MASRPRNLQALWDRIPERPARPRVTSSIGSRIRISDRVADDHAGPGLEFLDELRATYHRVAAGPFGHQDLRSGVRRALLRRFPYAVYFAVSGLR